LILINFLSLAHSIFRYQISLLVLLAFVAFAAAQSPATPKNFQIRVESRKTDKDQDLSPATLQQIRARQQQQQQPSSEFYSEEEDEDEENVPVQTFHRPASSPQRQYQPQPQQHHSQQPQQRSKTPLSKKQREQFEQELEEEEPDHLALLLEKSSFTCNGRTTGYYADDSVECQVFHYCQENTKHSWICPEGKFFLYAHL
jgi:Chitin binding Peritrophin-A domain